MSPDSSDVADGRVRVTSPATRRAHWRAYRWGDPGPAAHVARHGRPQRWAARTSARRAALPVLGSLAAAALPALLALHPALVHWAAGDVAWFLATGALPPAVLLILLWDQRRRRSGRPR